MSLGCSLLLALRLVSTGAGSSDDEIAPKLHEEIVHVPMVVTGAFWRKKEIALTATVYRPDGEGPFPLVVLSHGNPVRASDRPSIGRFRKLHQIREFIRRGFAVLVPIRRGYGATGGDWAEDYGRCDNALYADAGLEGARDVVAAVRHAAALPYVKADTIVLVGQSAGGFASLAAASLRPPGVVGVVNFSGGRGGRPDQSPGEPCDPGAMERAIRKYARTTTVPVLWMYAENDRFFGPHRVRDWFSEFQKAGGKGRLVIQPPFGAEGHHLFTSKDGIPLWTPEFDAFTKELGIVAKGPERAPSRPEVTGAGAAAAPP